MADNAKTEKVRPVHSIKAFPVEMAAWKNTNKDREGKEFDTISFTLTRSYKDKDGKYKSTESFRPVDLPKVTAVVQKMNDWVLFEHNSKAKDTGNEETVM